MEVESSDYEQTKRMRTKIKKVNTNRGVRYELELQFDDRWFSEVRTFTSKEKAEAYRARRKAAEAKAK